MTLQAARPTVKSLAWTLAHHAGAVPDCIACESAEGPVTYAGLWEAVGRCATFLQESSDVGDRVALQLPNGADLIAIAYACYLTGRVVVPLHAEARLPAVAAALRDCRPQLFIHSREWRCSTEDREVLAGLAAVTSAEAVFAGRSATLAPTAVASNQLARLVYTSGTTGAPKAVQLSHHNLASNARAIADYLELTPADRGLCQLPFTYAYGNSMLDSHLVAGATLVLEAQASFPARLAEALTRSRATGFSAVAATYVLLLDSGALQKTDLSRLRYVTQAGSRMAADRLAELRAVLGPSVSIYAMYGQTEATSRLTFLPPELLASKPGSVGRAIADTAIAVWNEQDQPLSAGAVGEIVARGPSIMLGYWQQPESTAATLTADGWLRTGDLGYQDEDGDLYVTGRRREMIKSGAHRIAPAEIEEAAQQAAPGLRLAAVGTPDAVLGERIQLAVHWPQAAAEQEQRALRQRLLRQCKAQLPLFKMPQDVRFVAEWPQTESGKLKRTALAGIVADQIAARDSC
ncbi:MAG: class I adenylate-forming enzyme family protein [Pseudomonadota bacterium]